MTSLTGNSSSMWVRELGALELINFECDYMATLAANLIRGKFKDEKKTSRKHTTAKEYHYWTSEIDGQMWVYASIVVWTGIYCGV